jgi:hypothetical protein
MYAGRRDGGIGVETDGGDFVGRFVVRLSNPLAEERECLGLGPIGSERVGCSAALPHERGRRLGLRIALSKGGSSRARQGSRERDESRRGGEAQAAKG